MWYSFIKFMNQVFSAKKFKGLLGVLIYFLLGIGGEENLVFCYEANGNVVLEFAERGSCSPKSLNDHCGPCVDVPVFTHLFINKNTDSFNPQILHPSARLTAAVIYKTVEVTRSETSREPHCTPPSLQRVILLI